MYICTYKLGIYIHLTPAAIFASKKKQIFHFHLKIEIKLLPSVNRYRVQDILKARAYLYTHITDMKW